MENFVRFEGVITRPPEFRSFTWGSVTSAWLKNTYTVKGKERSTTMKVSAFNELGNALSEAGEGGLVSVDGSISVSKGKDEKWYTEIKANVVNVKASAMKEDRPPSFDANEECPF